jgi:hypothetical protein
VVTGRDSELDLEAIAFGCLGVAVPATEPDELRRRSADSVPFI